MLQSIDSVVIAHEMKSLADDTRNQADRIRSLVETLQVLLESKW